MTDAQKIINTLEEDQTVIFYKLNREKKYMVIKNYMNPFLVSGDLLDVEDLTTNEFFTFRIKKMNKRSITADLIIN